MDETFYSSTSWRQLRALARERDANRCTVARLLGGRCSGLLHVHHIDRDADWLDLDNTGTVCAAHHPKWEALRRSLVEQRQPRWRTCPHRHTSAEAKAICERRLNRVAA